MKFVLRPEVAVMCDMGSIYLDNGSNTIRISKELYINLLNGRQDGASNLDFSQYLTINSQSNDSDLSM